MRERIFLNGRIAKVGFRSRTVAVGCSTGDRAGISLATTKPWAASPVSPSVTAIRTSLTPRVLNSLNTLIENFAPSAVSIHRSRITREASRPTPSGSYAALFRTPLSPRTFQEINQIHYLQRPAVTSASTLSVISRTVRPCAYRARMLSSNTVSRRTEAAVPVAQSLDPHATVADQHRLGGDDVVPVVMASGRSAHGARFIAIPAALIASPVIVPVRNCATSSFGIEGRTATARSASWFRRARRGVGHAIHAEVRTGSS